MSSESWELTQADALRREFEKWMQSVPKCIGYPTCDGDLVGTEHDELCPMSKIPESDGASIGAHLQDAFEAGWQAAREAAPLVKYEAVGDGLCSTHTGGPHPIERACKNWKPAAARPATGEGWIENRFDEFEDDSHPFRKWWTEHGQYMMSGGGRRESIWAARGWIAREQLACGAKVTGESLRERALPDPPKEGKS